MRRLVSPGRMQRRWRAALALGFVVAIGGCRSWDTQGDWGEVWHSTKNALDPNQGGVSSKAAAIDRRLQSDAQFR
jgi:hypothetical protein